MESLRVVVQDMRHGGRVLRKNFGFSLLAVLTLAIGIGSVTSIFAVVHATLLRRLPFPHADELVLLWGNTVRAGVVERRGASYPDFADWRQDSRMFEAMAAVENTDVVLREGEARRVSAELVSASYFDVLGVRPERGRGFLPAEDSTPDTHTSVVLGHTLWTQQFGADPQILGRKLRFGDQVYEVVGIMPAGFTGISDIAEVWFPMMTISAEAAKSRGSRSFPVIARLKPGVSREQAQAEMDSISRQLAAAYPQTNDQRGVEVIGLQEDTFQSFRRPLFVLLGAAGFVLLIACANIAGLMLARLEIRQREFAVRRVLGATPGRLFAQLFSESLVIATVGAGTGVLLAQWAANGLLVLSPVQLPSFVKISIDGPVLGFAIAATLLTALLVGTLPAMHESAAGNEALKTGAGHSTAGATRQRLRSALVIGEIGVAIALLVGAGLLIRSFQRLLSLDPGFAAAGLVKFELTLPEEQQNQNLVVKAQAIMDRVGTLPSVTKVSLSSDMPLDGNASAVFYTPEGQNQTGEQKRPRAYVHRVSPDFFATLRIPMQRGRGFAAEEMSAKVNRVVISEDVARRYWAGQDPLGRRLKFGPPDSQNPWLEVIGVVGDVKYRGLPQNPTPDPDLYLPLSEQRAQYSLAVRSSGKPEQLISAVTAEIRALDPGIAVSQISTVSDLVAARMTTARFARTLVALFAGMALLLALVGMYALISYIVSERTREIGIRLALGAEPKDIFARVIGQSLTLAGIGIAFGLMLALGAGKVLASLLFEVSSANPLVLGAVAFLVLITAVVASAMPARRATQVDPMVALRYE